MPYPPSPYDPTAFRGTAPFYMVGRPPYSEQLAETLVRELGLDGTGRLLDMGCGPGVLAIGLADLFSEVIGLDPEPGMLDEARRLASASGHEGIRWIEAVAEDLGGLDIGPCRLVTFGQSFHRMDRYRVAEAVYELLEPGGAVALVCHTVGGRPKPPDTGYPEIPFDEIKALVEDYLGPASPPVDLATEGPERWEETLRKTSFGRASIVFAPGRPELLRDTDSVVAGYFSMSWSAPPLFGERRGPFEAELRALLGRHSPEGLFWDWPGDTEIVYAIKE